ncbi:MAG: sodium:proton exchanger [Blastopirellula sp.]|nr:MAG: sodium:proton exchanger [Blastopirellula sp.]
MNDHVIYDLLIILTSGLVAGLVCKRLRVPILIGYMLVGILLTATGVVQESKYIGQLAEAGVFFLLFAIGLEFSLDELLKLSRHIFVGGSVQMLLVVIPISVALFALGSDWRTAILIGTAVAFSSTVLVFKTLAEWGRTNTKDGRHAIGILLFQDIALVPLLLVIPLLDAGDSPSLFAYLQLIFNSFAFVLSVVVTRWVLAKWLIPHLVSYRSPELVALAAIVVLGGVTFAAHKLGLPAAVGAFAAGLMLSGNRWTTQFDALVMPFREIFAVVFFVSLGLLLKPETVIAQPLQLLGMLIALLFIKAIAATLALKLTRLSWHSSMATGIGLAHVGEFAFVFIALMNLEEVTAQQFVAVSLASLMLSPLLLRYGLRRTARAGAAETNLEDSQASLYVASNYSIVIGIGPVGSRIASYLETIGHEVCMIDRSPLNLQPFEQQGFHAVSGDASDAATLYRANIQQATLVVICVPEDEASVAILKQIQRLNNECKIVVRCRYQSSVSRLMSSGANFVVSEETQSVEAMLQVLTEPADEIE